MLDTVFFYPGAQATTETATNYVKLQHAARIVVGKTVGRVFKCSRPVAMCTKDQIATWEQDFSNFKVSWGELRWEVVTASRTFTHATWNHFFHHSDKTRDLNLEIKVDFQPEPGLQILTKIACTLWTLQQNKILTNFRTWTKEMKLEEYNFHILTTMED